MIEETEGFFALNILREMNLSVRVVVIGRWGDMSWPQAGSSSSLPLLVVFSICVSQHVFLMMGPDTSPGAALCTWRGRNVEMLKRKENTFALSAIVHVAVWETCWVLCRNRQQRSQSRHSPLLFHWCPSSFWPVHKRVLDIFNLISAGNRLKGFQALG